VNRRLVDEIVTVTDEQMIDAMRFSFDRLKLVVEPSGAAALAAVLEGAVSVLGRRVGVVISGGNVGSERFAELVGA
jgi:threo-3-hydroxy-L-aspartate ammonia-lyase